MNRNQRRFYKPIRGKEGEKKKEIDTQKHEEIQEVFPPSGRQCPIIRCEKPMMNRCCFISPEQKDFGQLIVTDDIKDQYQTQLMEQYGFDPALPDTLNQLKELRKVLCGSSPKVENGSQYVSPDGNPYNLTTTGENTEDSHWQNIENTDEVDEFIGVKKEESNISVSRSIHISEIPRIKIIAEKFTKLKKNNLELRKLDEKVVCVEYDIYKGSNTAKPEQTMRAFFSVQPIQQRKNKDHETEPCKIFSNFKNKLEISDEELINNKEIEVIDAKIADNKPYLDDLMRILKRKNIINIKKNKTSLDLQSLYEMAKKESPPLDENFSDTNFLSKAELEEVKELILKKCTSSAYGISRRRLRKEDVYTRAISNSLIADLLNEIV